MLNISEQKDFILLRIYPKSSMATHGITRFKHKIKVMIIINSPSIFLLIYPQNDLFIRYFLQI